MVASAVASSAPLSARCVGFRWIETAAIDREQCHDRFGEVAELLHQHVQLAALVFFEVGGECLDLSIKLALLDDLLQQFLLMPRLPAVSYSSAMPSRIFLHFCMYLPRSVARSVATGAATKNEKCASP